MRIYHNIPALTAYNALNGTNTAMEKTIKQLSTGLRINSASDDAAGFAISEKMRSQISGLEVAIRNTQDATSMLQVAEGALGETNSMLQRMRELAVQASNDTLTAQDRSYIQLEINQLQDQIDRIANTTQFNKKRLLDGSSAGITSSSSLDVKAYVTGSLRELDQFGQKKSFEGNYRIQITVDPNQTGSGQVQKSSIMTIKHPNVITDVQANNEDGVIKVAVNDLPAGDYKVTVGDEVASATTIVGTYGFEVPDDEGVMTTALSAELESTLTFTGETAENNASILFEVVSVSDDFSSVTLKARSNILSADGTVSNAVRDNIIIKGGDDAEPADLSDLLGIEITDDEDYATQLSLAYTIPEDGGLNFSVGAKFVLNVAGTGHAAADETETDSTADLAVQISGKMDRGNEVDSGWPYKWEGEVADEDSAFYDGEAETQEYVVSKTLTYNINSELCQNAEINFRNFYLNTENGTVYEGDVILTTDDKFLAGDDGNISAGDELASFTAAYIGKTATGDTKLRDLNTFWNSSGVFMLESPQTITITQGDGKSASVTIYATDTVNELRAKFNDAIGNGLGQAKYIEGNYADKFCTFVEPLNRKTQGLETVGGTFIFRSLLAGSAGDLTFSGDEDLINTFALNVVQESSTSAFRASIYDAHTGTPYVSNVKVADNRLIGVLHDNIDIEFSATANIKATWSEGEDNFLLTAETKPYDAVIHIVDTSTVFQIGANNGEDIAIDIGNMSVGSLGITNVNVSTREAASRAIGTIDAAINKVSTQRAKIGAYQNALEYTSDNLTTTMTNLSAAESRIRDADMAATMMEFVKLQILNQSGTSMLAQANQLPQSVLSLLQ